MRRLAYERSGEARPELVMVNYGLLFASIFFAGATALVAVVLAYAWRDAADTRLRSHYDFQIRIFWVSVLLILLAAACGLVGVAAGLAGVLSTTTVSLFDAERSVQVDMGRITLNHWVLLLMGVGVLLTASSFVWVICTTIFGFIRLASARPMGDSAAP